MARKSSFTIRAQKRVRYTDAGDVSERAGGRAGDAEDEKENANVGQDEVKERGRGGRDEMARMQSSNAKEDISCRTAALRKRTNISPCRQK